MKIFVKCRLQAQRQSNSIFSSAAENIGFTVQIKFDAHPPPPHYLLSKICEIQKNKSRERGLFPKEKGGIFLHVSEFSVLEFVLIAILKDFG